MREDGGPAWRVPDDRPGLAALPNAKNDEGAETSICPSDWNMGFRGGVNARARKAGRWSRAKVKWGKSEKMQDYADASTSPTDLAKLPPPTRRRFAHVIAATIDSAYPANLG